MSHAGESLNERTHLPPSNTRSPESASLTPRHPSRPRDPAQKPPATVTQNPPHRSNAQCPIITTYYSMPDAS